MSDAPGFDELVRLATSADPAEVDRAHEYALVRMRGDRRLQIVAAMAYDRIRVLAGRPQKFGTQAIADGGRLVPWPVDPATTDTERAKWGVATLQRLLERIVEAPIVDKAMLRSLLRARRRAVDDVARQAAAERIREHGLATFGSWCQDRVVAAYWPLPDEADPRPLARALRERHGARLALPVVDGEHLTFRAWRDDAELRPAGFGTLGPAPVATELQPDVVLAPLVGLDARGGRIGQGKGFYDRATARLDQGPGVRVVGVAFACQLLPAVPTEVHDRRLDGYVTEAGATALSR
ncbi:MAG: 5-formyltetrahydrofolate cyclo-ligase [Planctomycetota bacterium]